MKVAVLEVCNICLRDIPEEMLAFRHGSTKRVVCERCIRAIEGAIEKRL